MGWWLRVQFLVCAFAAIIFLRLFYKCLEVVRCALGCDLYVVMTYFIWSV